MKVTVGCLQFGLGCWGQCLCRRLSYLFSRFSRGIRSHSDTPSSAAEAATASVVQQVAVETECPAECSLKQVCAGGTKQVQVNVIGYVV